MNVYQYRRKRGLESCVDMSFKDGHIQVSLLAAEQLGMSRSRLLSHVKATGKSFDEIHFAIVENLMFCKDVRILF